MLITVALSVEEHAQLEKLARHRANMDAETLLRCITGDLVHSTWTGGSDERMYAHQWLDRRFGDEWFARELAKDRKAAKRPVPQPVEREEPQEDYFDKLLAKQKGGSK
jgi:hypothetical protein